jgi:hypothetical protein
LCGELEYGNRGPSSVHRCFVTCKCTSGNVRLVHFLGGHLSSRPSMTRNTRRTTRKSASELSGSGAAGSGSPSAETALAYSQEDLCPSCNVSLTRDLKDEDSESWVRCDFCKTWYHWRCVGENGQLEVIDKWSVLLPPPIMLLVLYPFLGSAVPVEPPIVNALSP